MHVKNFAIKRYETSDYTNWNAFVDKAKNATFLFHRDFMEYHADRFSDFSLLIFDNNKLVALLPANKTNATLYSHQGLTYGGLVIQANTKVADVVGIFYSLLKFLSENDIQKLHIKAIPGIYCDYFSEEMTYALFLADAKLVRRDCLSVLDLTKPFQLTKTRRQGVRRGVKNNLEIREEANFALFWNDILIPNMDYKHETTPVHTLQEIQKLHAFFPENIRHFNVYHENKIVGGTTVFITKHVIHPQYISGQADKNELGTLDFLYHHLITEVFAKARYFDFGISNESNGRNLNEGLIFWKESFGTATITQDFHEVETANYKLLENVLI